MKNKLTDLNNHLFAQLERLGDEDLEADKLSAEIERARAVTSVAKEIIASGSLAVKAAELVAEYQSGEVKLPPLLTSGD